MAQFDPKTLHTRDIYALLVGAIAPRPIALVTTRSREGVVNAAPFSSYSLVSSDPPSLLFTTVEKPSGEKKDTLRNIEETGEFVVNSAQTSMLKEVAACGADHPPHVSEVEITGLTTIDSVVVSVPRLHESKINFECKLLQQVSVGSNGKGVIVVGEIVYIHLSDEIIVDNRIDISRFDPLSRLGGDKYARVGEILAARIPKIST